MHSYHDRKMTGRYVANDFNLLPTPIKIIVGLLDFSVIVSLEHKPMIITGHKSS